MTGSLPLVAPPLRLNRFRMLLRTFGALRITLTLTLLSIVLSVLSGLVLTPIFIGPVSQGTVFVTVLIPALIAPPVVYLALRMVVDLDRAEMEMRRMSITDDLTQIFNRRHLIATAESALSRARRYGEKAALILFDLDHFKEVNDLHGHQTGDRVLQEVARRAASCLRDTDVFARYGGEEFVILLPHTERDGAGALAERIRARVNTPIRDEKGIVLVSLSAGVTEILQEDTVLDDLFRRADRALYGAKDAGRNRVVVL